MKLRILTLTVLAGLAGALMLDARSRHKRSRPDAAPGSFAYYLLVLSYAPDFCDQPQGNKDPRECGKGRHVGYVVHGLWPQGETTRGPENCGSSPVSQSLVQFMLRYIPTESLIQHEWQTHGSCTGLSAADYFGLVRKARDAVTIPTDLTAPTQQLQLSPSDVESKFAGANPKYPRNAFRTSCYRNQELEEIRICLSTDLTPRACGSSAGECSANSVVVLPVR